VIALKSVTTDLITHSSDSGSSTVVFNPEGSRENPRQRLPSVEQRRARLARPIPHTLRLEKSDPRMCEFFNKREVAGNGNSSCRRSTSHSTIQKWNAPLSSHFLHPTVETSYPFLSLSQSSVLAAHTSRSIHTSTELRRVPEDGDAMEFHPPSFSHRNSQHPSHQEGVRHDSLSRTPVLRSQPQNFEGQSPNMGDEEEEEEGWLDEQLVRQGLYQGTPLFSNTFSNHNHLDSKQDLTINLSSCTV